MKLIGMLDGSIAGISCGATRRQHLPALTGPVAPAPEGMRDGVDALKYHFFKLSYFNESTLAINEATKYLQAK
jgi:hypothetical protein